MDAAAVSLPTVPSLSAAATASAATVRSKHEPNGRGVTSQSHGFYTYTTGAVPACRGGQRHPQRNTTARGRTWRAHEP
jgi:hypothetical protein